MASKEVLARLESVMARKIPNAKLAVTALPMVPEISLALIEESYPQANLTQDQVEGLMDNPPYWAFCWASGQVMARHLLDQTELVHGKTVIDFGCGSGVVAIAAHMAGATHCIALDMDENAIEVSKLNAKLNNVDILCCSDLSDAMIDTSNAVLLIADVFYDAENIPLLKGFIRDYADVIVADSRVKPDALDGVIETARYDSRTVPDLAEASDFNSVGVYRVAY